MLDEFGIDALSIICLLIVSNKLLASIREKSRDENMVHEALVSIKKGRGIWTNRRVIGVQNVEEAVSTTEGFKITLISIPLLIILKCRKITRI